MTCVYGIDAVAEQTWLSTQLGRDMRSLCICLTIVHLASSEMQYASHLAFPYGPHAAASDACVIAITPVDKQAMC